VSSNGITPGAIPAADRHNLDVMRTAKVLLLAALFVARASARDLAIVGATVYTDPYAAPIANAVVLIHDDKIAAVRRADATKIARDAAVIDAAGKFVTAGFWNSHVHLFTPALLHASDAKAADLDAALETMLNRWGFTSVFDLASVLDNTLALRKRIESGEVRGPRILTVGEPLWTQVPVYVRRYLEENGIAMPVVSTAVGAAARVRDEANRGANGVKLFTGSYQGQGVVANMPLELVEAAVAEAHRRHLPVFAHPQNLAGVEVAIRGGVDILAHTVPDSPEWTEAFVDRLESAHMSLIPTLTLFDFEARQEKASDADRLQWIGKMTAELRAFASRGGDVLFGTDIGYIDHFDTTLEFELMSQAGLTGRDILATLTTNPARRFGFGSRSGRVLPDYDADLVVLDADPAADARNLSKVRFTIRGGRIIFAAK
jgi:imidazolonepropionase-like amidohydrolase